jgi:SepF-like predicted cell division protein (DUF552 family)
MPKRVFPSAELYAALAGLLGLENLNDVRKIGITIEGGNAVLVDVQMFVWDHDRLTSITEQLTADKERVTNVVVEVTPKLLEATTEPD